MDIREYLLKQKSLANDLNEVLLKLDSLSIEEREKICEENKDTISEIDRLNRNNNKITKDRIEELKLKVEDLLKCEESKRDWKYYGYIKETYNEIIRIENRINELSNSLENTSISNIEINKDEIIEENINSDINKDTSSIEKFKEDIKIEKKNIAQAQNKYKNIVQAQNKHKEENKFEFKVGANILSIIGVVLILISFVTFGRYVYVNYMSDMVKGISLFVISLIILICGELVHRKLNNKFSIGIISLGIGSLYSSVIINYLSLRTINSIVALVITAILSGLSILISSKHNSNIIRLVALVGGYVCLVPMNTLDTIQSITTVIILCFIGLINILKPIKNENSKISFNVYSIVLNLIVYINITLQGFLDDSAIIGYSIVVCVLLNILFLREVKKESKNTIYRKVGLISLYILFSIVIAMFIDINEKLINILFIAYLLILIALFFKEKRKQWILYIQFVITIIFIFFNIENYYLLTGALIILTLISSFLTVKHNDIFIKVSNYICITFSILDFFSRESYLEILLYRLIYVLVFAVSVYALSLNNKNSKILIVFKYIYIILFMLFFNSIRIFTGITNESIIVICIGFTLTIIMNQFHILRHKNIENYNFVVLLILAFINIFTLIFYDLKLIQFIVLVILGISNMILIKKLYNKENIIINNIYFIGGIYLTLSIFRLSTLRVFSYNITSIFTNVLLMVLSFICIWIGFKLRIKKLRKYGLIISLLTCTKVMFIDSYSSNFIMKTIVFLLMGCIALLISYIYSKIEKRQ